MGYPVRQRRAEELGEDALVGDLVVAGEAVPGLGEELFPAVRPVAGGVFDGDVGGEVVFGGVFLRDGFGGVGDVEGDVETGEFALGFFGEDAGPFLGCDDVDDFYAVPVGVVVGADFGGDEAVDCALGAWTGVDAGVGLVLTRGGLRCRFRRRVR